MSGVLNKIKNQIKNSSRGFDDEFRLGEDESARVRFLTKFNDATEIIWHDMYDENIDTPCLKYYGVECPLCERDKKDEDLRTRSLFVWTVYNREQEKKQVFKFPANKFSPVPALVQMYEEYGTLIDRDYKITRTGTGFDINYQAIPMSKEEFDKDEEDYSEKELFDLFKTIHNVQEYADGSFEEEDDVEEEEPEEITDLDVDDVDFDE